MSKNNNLIRQGAILAIASLVVRFVGFLYRIPLTQMIGDEGIAIYSISFNIYTVFLVISSQGLPIAISKLVSEENENRRYHNSHKIFVKTMQFSVVISLICCAILFFGATFIENFYEIKESRYAIKVLAPTVLVVGIMAVFRGYFQGMNNTIPTALSQIFEQIINAFISIYFAYLLMNIDSSSISKAALGAMGGTFGTLFGAITGLVVLVLIYFLLKPEIFKKINKNSKEEWETKELYEKVLKTSIPIILGTLVFSITNIIDGKMIMERLINGVGMVEKEATILYGQYSGKYTVISNLPVSIATAFATAGVPVVASLRKKRDFRELSDKINSMVRISMLFCIPACFGIAVLSDQLLLFLYNSENGGAMILRTGSLSIIFIALTQIFTGILQGIGRADIAVKSALIACIIKIPVNFLLIGTKFFNIYGAIISTTIVYMITAILNYNNIKHRCRLKFDFKGAIIKPTFASIIMSLVTFFVYKIIFVATNSNSLGVIISLILSVFAYFGVLIISRGLVEEDLRAIPKGYKLVNILKSKNLL